MIGVWERAALVSNLGRQVLVVEANSTALVASIGCGIVQE